MRDTVAWIDAQPDGTPVTLIRSPTKTGFAGEHNQAMAAHPTDFFLLLNSGALVRPGCLGALLSAARAAPQKTGLFGCHLVDEDGVAQASSFRFAGIRSELIRGANTGLVTRLMPRAVVALGPDPDPGDIDWVSFASVLVRDDMVQDIGPMDEGYFLYFEDTEYALRARRAGWGPRHAPHQGPEA